MKKLLIIDVAALGWDLVQRYQSHIAGINLCPIETVFPATTCPVQASFRTATPPVQHGVIANGFFSRELQRPFFWEQSAKLVTGKRMWHSFRRRGGRVGLFFWQQSLGEEVDWVLSPKPVHKHHGGMIQDCYSQPQNLYERLNSELRRPFNLMHYWGPLASLHSSEWIADAVSTLVQWPDAPELLLAYLPHLDYNLQRYGPDSASAAETFEEALALLSRMIQSARNSNYDIVLFGDYAMQQVSDGAIFPNRVLADAGLLKTRQIKNMLYPDYYTSRAFALVDHEIAHVYTADKGAADAAVEIFDGMTNIEVLEPDLMSHEEVDNERAGNFMLIAEPGSWFAYPWWYKKRETPDYAAHVDIHNKPGFDPCELFFSWMPPNISLDTDRIKGTHGRAGSQHPTAWGTTLNLPTKPSNLLELSSLISEWLVE